MPDIPDSRYPRPAQPGRPESQPTDQRKALDLAEAFREHDLAMLRRLDSDELAEQRQAREQLWDYVDHMWDFIKDYQDRYPHGKPVYSAVMGMRDLASALCGNASLVAHEEDDLGN